MSETMRAFTTWVKGDHANRRGNFRGYAYGIAQARYITRKVFRLVDEQAKGRPGTDAASGADSDLRRQRHPDAGE